MKTSIISLKSIAKVLVISLIVSLIGACNGGENTNTDSSPQSSDPSSPPSNISLVAIQDQLKNLQNDIKTTQNQIADLRNQSTTLRSQLNDFQENIATLQTTDSSFAQELNLDEAKLRKITLLGHQPDIVTARTNRASRSFNVGLDTIQSISFGPCSDMGVFIGSGQMDSLTATVENFRQCTGYEYGAIVETGVIIKPFALWFDGANCTGNMFEAENDGGYNRQVLQNGVVFVSPIDGSTALMVEAGQSGKITTLLSNFSGGGCNSAAVEIQIAYRVTPNDLGITGVPPAVPANFIF